MLSIQEMVNKTEQQRKQVEDVLDQGYYDFNEASILKDQGRADRKELLETLRVAPLREFLAKSGTTGIAGAAYLIPDKIYQVMFDSAVEADICDQISIAMVPADQIPGSTLKVDIAVDDSYKPKVFSSGGAMPEETIKTTQVELDFSEVWGINFRITNDLIEDSQFDVIEMHLRNAGREMGEYATNKALTVMKTGSTGADGTLNPGAVFTTDADVTDWCGDTTMDVEKGIDYNIQDGYVSDTLVLSHHAMIDNIMRSVGTANTAESQPWIYNVVAGDPGGWPTRMFGINIIYTEVDAVTNSGNYTGIWSILFDKDYALLTGRKRWLRIEKYSDPIRDLVGATVTARQNSVTVYNDSICLIKETT